MRRNVPTASSLPRSREGEKKTRPPENSMPKNKNKTGILRRHSPVRNRFTFIFYYTPHIVGPDPDGPSLGPGRHRHRSSSSTRHTMCRGPGRPVKTCGSRHMLCRAAFIKPTSHGPRSGPAHQISSRWAVARPGASSFEFSSARPARPGSSHFQTSRPDLAWPFTFSNFSARPGPPGP